MVIKYFLDQLDPEGREGSYDSSKDPVVIQNIMTAITLYVADPIMLQDLFVSKSAIYDKTGSFAGIFSKLFGKSFLFSKGDADWRAKRKACAHAFYKDRLELMLEVLKEKIQGDCQKWRDQIEKSYYKKITVDFSLIFSSLFARNIIHISFGEDISEYTVVMWCQTPG